MGVQSTRTYLFTPLLVASETITRYPARAERSFVVLLGRRRI